MGLSGIGGSFGSGFNPDSGDKFNLDINPVDFAKELDLALDKTDSSLGVKATESMEEKPPVQLGDYTAVTKVQTELFKKAKRTDSPPFQKFKEQLSQGISQK